LYIFKKENNVVKTEDHKIIKNLQNSGLIKKTDNVLDYGCGLGIWDNDAVNKGIFFNKLLMYDKNPEARNYCKKKYPNHTIVNDVTSELDVNVIFSNSVIQYIDIKTLEKLFEQFANMLKKDEIVILSGNPRYPRIFECVLTFFGNFNLFKIQIKQFLKSDYRSTNFYRHSIDELRSMTKNYFTLTQIQNLESNKNRDTVYLKRI
jgi:SAM-dependent methyltransferase|tara:strand:- start:658 stop:1272 length:615 start_codon:yes stop_codon:yes gene_type:complete